QDAECDVPTQHHLHHYGHGEHVDAAHQHDLQCEGDGGKDACVLAEAQVQVAGDRVRLRYVIEGHHHQAEEEHGGDGANPIPVGGEDAVLVCRACPAHQLKRSEVGGD